MFDSIFVTSVETVITPLNLIIALATSLVLGFGISLAYMKTHAQKAASQSFTLTLIMLPAVITVIILMVGGNVARAFSLAGAFSIIRFRSAPGDAKDISYVLFTMAVGLASGMGYIAYAFMVAAVLCLVMVVLELTGYGREKITGKQLRIVMPENVDYREALEDVLMKYTDAFTLSRVKTTDLGSLYELSYEVQVKDSVNEKEFIDALRCRNGNLNITLMMNERKSELL